MQVTAPCLGNYCFCLFVVSPDIRALRLPNFQFYVCESLHIDLDSVYLYLLLTVEDPRVYSRKHVPTTGLHGSDRRGDVNNPVDDCCGSEVCLRPPTR
jgi:hypothetical protein